MLESRRKVRLCQGWWFNREYLLATPAIELAPALVEVLAQHNITTTPERAAAVIAC